MDFKRTRSQSRFFNFKFQHNKKRHARKPNNIISQATVKKLIAGKKTLKKVRRTHYVVARLQHKQGKRSMKLILRKNKVRYSQFLYNAHAAGLTPRRIRAQEVRKLIKVPEVNKIIKLSTFAKYIAIRRYNRGLALKGIHWAYVWACLKELNPTYTLRDRYTRFPEAHKWEKIQQQAKWERRQWGRKTWSAKKPFKGRFWVTKQQTLSVGRYMRRFKYFKALLVKKRHKFAAWRRVVLKNARHWKYKGLKSKLRAQSAQTLHLRHKFSLGRKLRRRIFKRFRKFHSRVNKRIALKAIRDFVVRDRVRAQRKLERVVRLKRLAVAGRNRIKHYSTYKIHGRAVLKNIWALEEKERRILARITRLEAPLPWWKTKNKKVQIATKLDAATVHALAIFNEAFPLEAMIINRKQWKTKRPVRVALMARFGTAKKRRAFIKRQTRRPIWINRFKWRSTRYSAFKSLVQWGGLLNEFFINQDYRRLRAKKKKGKPVKKRGFLYKIPTVGTNASQFLRTRQHVGLKFQLGQYTNNSVGDIADTLPELLPELLLTKPLFFSLKKADTAQDFNKFFKVNKITARAVEEISNELYSQYITNLHEQGLVISSMALKDKKETERAARLVRKYVQLLRAYFKEIYDNKFIKKVPADTEMYWVREYLRVTSGMRRRVSLWNRFNRVNFHFTPKAKEEDKRGRKKKILFKVKILFDRLFKWLYEQPNARYALAAPIQTGVIRDYLVRNQFVFKKHFKVKLASKLV